MGCACGRKCVWPGLSCDSALTLSSVIWPPPAPGAGAGDLRAVVGRGKRGGGCCGSAACAPGAAGGGCAPLGGVAVAVGLGLESEAPPPSLAAPVCRSVSGDFLWHGVRLGNATRCAGAGRGGKGVAWAL